MKKRMMFSVSLVLLLHISSVSFGMDKAISPGAISDISGLSDFSFFFDEMEKYDKVTAGEELYRLNDLFVYKDGNNVRVTDIEKVEEKCVHKHPTADMAFLSNNGIVVASASSVDGTIYIKNLKNGTSFEYNHEAGITSMCFNQEGTFFASGSQDGSVVIVDVNNPKNAFECLNNGAIRNMCFSKNGGSLLAFTSANGTVKVYDYQTGNCVWKKLLKANAKITTQNRRLREISPELMQSRDHTEQRIDISFIFGNGKHYLSIVKNTIGNNKFDLIIVDPKKNLLIFGKVYNEKPIRCMVKNNLLLVSFGSKCVCINDLKTKKKIFSGLSSGIVIDFFVSLDKQSVILEEYTIEETKENSGLDDFYKNRIYILEGFYNEIFMFDQPFDSAMHKKEMLDNKYFIGYSQKNELYVWDMQRQKVNKIDEGNIINCDSFLYVRPRDFNIHKDISEIVVAKDEAGLAIKLNSGMIRVFDARGMQLVSFATALPSPSTCKSIEKCMMYGKYVLLQVKEGSNKKIYLFNYFDDANGKKIFEKTVGPNDPLASCYSFEVSCFNRPGGKGQLVAFSCVKHIKKRFYIINDEICIESHEDSIMILPDLMCLSGSQKRFKKFNLKDNTVKVFELKGKQEALDIGSFVKATDLDLDKKEQFLTVYFEDKTERYFDLYNGGKETQEKPVSPVGNKKSKKRKRIDSFMPEEDTDESNRKKKKRKKKL